MTDRPKLTPTGRRTTKPADEAKQRPSVVHHERQDDKSQYHSKTIGFSTRDERSSPPGWVKFVPPQGGLKRISMLTLRLRHVVSERPLETLGELAASELKKHRTNLRDLLGGIDRDDRNFPRTFLPKLDPYDETAEPMFDREKVLRALYVSGWLPPMRGAVFQPPPWRDSEGARLLVLSHNYFNERFFFPEVVVVRLLTHGDAQGSNHQVELTPDDGLSQAVVADCASAFSYSFSQNWFDPCTRCFNPPDDLERLLVPGEQGGCLRCDGKIALGTWPLSVDHVRSKAVNRVANAVLDMLGC